MSRWRAPLPAQVEAFEVFVRERGPALLSLARGLATSGADADDLLQETLAKTLERWELVARADDPAAYVNRIMVNTATSGWRRYGRHEGPGVHDTTSHPLSHRAEGADATAAADDRDEVLRALARLPARQRAVIVLRYYEDLPDAQIAEVLGIAPVSVRTSASRALSALRRTHTSSAAWLARTPAAVTAVCVLVVILSGCAGSPAAPGAPSAERAFTLPADAAALAVSDSGTTAWALVSGTGSGSGAGSTDGLYRLDATSGASRRFAVATSDYSGVYSRVVVVGDTVIAVHPHRLVALDPATGHSTTADLPEHPAGATADAFAADNPSPGTWISAVARRGATLVVARNNVPSLSVYDTSLRLTATLPLPEQMAGPEQLAVLPDGTVLMSGSPTRGQLGGALAPDGRFSVRTDLDAARLASSATGQVVALTAGQHLQRLSAGHTQPVGDELVAATALARGSGTTFTYSTGDATLRRYDDDGASRAVRTLPMDTGTVEKPDGSGEVTVRTPTPVDGMAATRTRVWLLEGRTVAELPTGSR